MRNNQTHGQKKEVCTRGAVYRGRKRTCVQEKEKLRTGGGWTSASHAQKNKFKERKRGRGMGKALQKNLMSKKVVMQKRK